MKVVLFFWFSETGFHVAKLASNFIVAKDGFELIILLHLPPKLPGLHACTPHSWLAHGVLSYIVSLDDCNVTRSLENFFFF